MDLFSVQYNFGTPEYLLYSFWKEHRMHASYLVIKNNLAAMNDLKFRELPLPFGLVLEK